MGEFKNLFTFGKNIKFKYLAGNIKIQSSNGDFTKRLPAQNSCCSCTSLAFSSRPPVIFQSFLYNRCNINKNLRYRNNSSFSQNIQVLNSASDKCNTKLKEKLRELLTSSVASYQVPKMGKLFSDDESVIKIRGLPWSATEDEIINFFDGIKIKNGRAGVHITSSKNGRPSGEAFIDFESEDDVEQALLKDKEHMGRRYIEVFKVNRSEMDWIIKRAGVVSNNSLESCCVRLRGLPFDSTKDDIEHFFDGLSIIPNGITMSEDYNGRCNGEAYVQFVDKETVEQALLKHKEKIGHRYIEIFRSSLDEIRSLGSDDYVDKMRPSLMGQGYGRPSPYDRNDRFGGGNRFGAVGGGVRGPRGGNFRGGGGFQDDDRWDQPSAPGPFPWSNMGGAGGGGSAPRGGRWSSDAGPSRISVPGTHVVHMRGLPFRAKESDIADFFRPIEPVDIVIQYDNSGRPSGEADVEFSCHEDALQAMSKDKSNMQHRYIELFLNSSNANSGGRGGGGSGGGFGGPGLGGSGGGFGGDVGRFDAGMFDRRPTNNRPWGNFKNNNMFDY